MNFLDSIEIGTRASRRFATLVAVLTMISFLVWPTQSFNFVHGQTLDSVAGSTELLASRWGVHCVVVQDGVLSPATMNCESGP